MPDPELSESFLTPTHSHTHTHTHLYQYHFEPLVLRWQHLLSKWYGSENSRPVEILW